MCYPTQEIESNGCHGNGPLASPAYDGTAADGIRIFRHQKQLSRPLKKRSFIRVNNNNNSSSSSSSSSSHKKSCLAKKKGRKSACRSSKQSVKFSPFHNQIFVIPSPPTRASPQQGAANEQDLLWHTKEDLEAIQDIARVEVLTAALSLQLTNKEPEGFTGRGLELQLSQTVRDQRKAWVGTTVGGVLLVQALHKRVNQQQQQPSSSSPPPPPNPELLRRISLEGSAMAGKAAILLGAIDAQEAKQSYI